MTKQEIIDYMYKNHVQGDFKIEEMAEDFAQPDLQPTCNQLATDTISRQDAIDAVEFGITYAKAINKSTGEVKELFKEGNKALNEAVERLKELPSAEPERKIELQWDESAIEILSELRSWFSCFDEKEGLAYHALSLAIRAIKANSIVQAERKTGRWVKDNYGNTVCSECLGIRRDNRINYINFCNQCGADMRGEQK